MSIEREKLRDYFAAKALQGLSAHITGPKTLSGESSAQAHARVAYGYADAMMAEKEKRGVQR